MDILDMLDQIEEEEEYNEHQAKTEQTITQFTCPKTATLERFKQAMQPLLTYHTEREQHSRERMTRAYEACHTYHDDPKKPPQNEWYEAMTAFDNEHPLMPEAELTWRGYTITVHTLITGSTLYSIRHAHDFEVTTRSLDELYDIGKTTPRTYLNMHT